MSCPEDNLITPGKVLKLLYDDVITDKRMNLKLGKYYKVFESEAGRTCSENMGGEPFSPRRQMTIASV